MDARAIDDAALRLSELREQEWEDLGLGALALGLSVAATEVLPSLALPLFFGGLVVGFLGVRALIRRWDLVEQLVDESDAYVLPEVLERASREATMERRRTFAALIRSALRTGDSPSETPWGAAAVELGALASQLDDDTLALEPFSAVACLKLVNDLRGSPALDELSPELLRWRIQEVRAGFTARPVADSPSRVTHSRRLGPTARSARS
jgi:hypothetical protein